ncbi:helix-turn-helix transcriptional regulator [Actinomadura sp. NPDC047616]|uniref:helix-turn-helix domain-containing protein n=1 Tax=Actinomadura sp. NPDC047616 TaxID=3155914 RepID=UPI0033D0CB79
MTGQQPEQTRDPLIRAFGAVLRSYREGAGLSRLQLAEALGCTPGWIEKMETGTKPSVDSAIDLDTFFKIPEKTFQKMAEEIEKAGRHVAPPPGFNHYLEYEAKADSLHIYGAMLVSGLCQSEGYARAIIGANQQPDAVEPLLRKRMDRKNILMREDPPRVWLTLDENVLRRQIGSPEVMQEQLQHLLDLSLRPKVHVHIVPHDVGYHEGLGGSCTLLSFIDGPGVAYIESFGQGLLIQEASAVARCSEGYSILRSHALSVDESRAVIKSIMESYENP